MKNKIFIVVIFLMTIASIGVLQTKPTVPFLSLILNKEEQRLSGLHKLSNQERNFLDRTLFRIFLLSKRKTETKFEEVAAKYLKEEGWEEVKVLNHQIEELEDDWLIVKKGSRIYILEARGYHYNLKSKFPPGIYPGKMGYSSSEVIDIEGETVNFWTKETK